jgi:hypothetical protein
VEASILKTMGLIAGIAGLSLGVLLIVLRGIIRKRIFPKFKNEKLAYRLLRLIVIVVWTVAIVGIAAWVITTLFAKGPGDNITVTNNEYNGDIHLDVGGVILNQYQKFYGKPLEDKVLKDEIKRATNLIKGGIYEDALTIFKEIAEKLELPAVYNNIGGLHAIMKNPGKAREAYIKAIEKDSGYQPVQFNLGLLLERQGKMDEALSHFDKAPDLKHYRRAGPARKVTFTTTIGERIETKKAEKEPNNKMPELDNQIPLGKWIQGKITGESDKDFFEIRTPHTCRDIIKIELQNTNTSLAPSIGIYHGNKKLHESISGSTFYVTPGQDIERSFLAKPGSVYFVLIEGIDDTEGPYLLKVTPMKAYDSYEENKDRYHAREISFGKTIDANIMDAGDKDFYSVRTSANKTSVVISLENKSTTLKPQIDIYRKNKQKIGGSQADPDYVTPGQDMEYSFLANPNSVYFICIKGQSGTGAYRLTAMKKSVAQT